MIMSKQEIINQTEFASQEPIFEDPVVIETGIDKQPTSKKKSKKMLLVILIAFTAFIFLLLVMIIASQNGDNGISQQDKKEEEEIEEQIEQDPQQLRLKQLKVDLKNADPAKKELIFPPVDLKLELDSTKQF
jgi:flagellar basal body-associated protein FliL